VRKEGGRRGGKGKRKKTENQPVSNERSFVLFVTSMFFIVTGITSEVNWNSLLLSHA
jgi:hypothetical protein